jgi:hypothetical protein
VSLDRRLARIEDLAARIAAAAHAVRELEGSVGRLAQEEAGRMVDACSDLWDESSKLFDQLSRRPGGNLGAGVRRRIRQPRLKTSHERGKLAAAAAGNFGTI